MRGYVDFIGRDPLAVPFKVLLFMSSIFFIFFALTLSLGNKVLPQADPTLEVPSNCLIV